MTVSRRLPLLLAACATLALAGACGLFRGFAEGPATAFTRLPAAPDRRWLGAARFTYDDFGGVNTDALETSAIPWKVASTALVLQRVDSNGAALSLATLNQALGEFGFIVPTSIANWPAGPAPRAFEQPLGIVTGYAGRSFLPLRYKVQIANLGCAACHAGVTYDARGMPRRDVWLGLPNTSIDLEAFSWGLYRALQRETRDPSRLLAAVRQLYPETDSLEIETIRVLLLPRITRRLRQLESTIAAPAPHPNGSPGMTNGVGALKRQMHVLRPGSVQSEVGFNSIPELGDVVLRSSLLSDGAYAPLGATRFQPLSRASVTDAHIADLAGIVAFFTVPAMGNPPDRAEREIPKVVDALQFLREYEAPRFPGPIDSSLAREGREVYRARCAVCHGTYDESLTHPRLLTFPNRLVPQAEIGSDRARLAVQDTALLRALLRSAYRRHVAVAGTGGYVAPRLSGLWATAPYLHNGSVPTLWHLMHPESRPTRFYVGGHRLDLDLVGIAGSPNSDGTWQYPRDYVPWSHPYLYDTERPGRGNRGHEREFSALSEQEKRVLLEFLKLL